MFNPNTIMGQANQKNICYSELVSKYPQQFIQSFLQEKSEHRRAVMVDLIPAKLCNECTLDSSTLPFLVRTMSDENSLSNYTESFKDDKLCADS